MTSHTRSRLWKWLLTLLVIGALAVGASRIVGQRKAQQQQAEQAAARVESVIELVPADLAQVQQRELTQRLAVSGTLKATRSAVIKARVAGELQDLNLREGDMVQAGQVVARVDATDTEARLRQARQQAEAARSQVEIAQRSYDNNRTLVEKGFISKFALDSASASLATAQANYQAAVAGIDVISKQVQDTVLRAPITGQVAQRLAQNGERIGVDGRVLELVDIRQLELEASLAAADSPLLRLGQVAELQIEGSDAPVRATVVRINPTVMAGSRSVLAYLALAPTQGLRQGLFAQGSLVVGSRSSLALPVSAVRNDRPRPYVQIVRDNKVVHQNVDLGAQGQFDGQWMVAVDGLAAGTTVIAGSVGRLREGTAVKLAGSPL
ncbi:MAG: efflux RND transporter periplasmic adaptor subunit [Rhodoferax sp.]|nr:efflux RND transporter periplasmic adaptor subunit [Rhodoferax sp.]